MSEEKFIPEVGQECEVLNTKLGNPEWEACRIDFIGCHSVVYTSISCLERTGYIGSEVKFRPLKSKADKERDKQIEQFKLKVFRGNGFALGETKETGIAIKAVDNGFRMLKEGGEIGRRLSDEELEEVMQYWNDHNFALLDLAKSIQNAIFGDE